MDTPNVSNYSGQGGLLPFLSSLLGGIHGVNQQAKQEKQQDTENQYKQDYLKFQNNQLNLEATKTGNEVEAQKKASAQGQYDQLNKMFVQNPQYAKDPAIVASWNKAANDAGLPAARNADGTPNIDALKPGWATLAVADQQKIMEMPVAQRKVLLQQYGSVPKDAFKTDAYVTAKDQAAMQRVKIYGEHEGTWEANSAKGLAIRQQIANATAGVDSARINSLAAGASLATARAGAIPVQLRQSQERIDMEGKRVQGYIERVQQTGDKNTLSQLATASRSLTGAISNAQRDYEKAANDYNTQIANGADPSDPGVASAADAMNQAKGQLENVQQYAQQANSLLGSTSTYAKNLTTQSGKPTTITTSGKVKNGKVAPGIYTLHGARVRVDENGNYFHI